MYELEARRLVEIRTQDVEENDDHIAFINRLLSWSNVLTFLIYFLFAFALWVGDFWNIKTLMTDFLTGSVGIVVYGIVAVLMAMVLAGTKHASYNHFAKFPIARIFLSIMVATGIAAESFTSSAVQDVKARATASQNTEYTALTSSAAGDGIAASSQLAAKIAHAQKVLERCKYDLAAGKEKHCNGDQGTLDALLASQQAELNAQVLASNANQQMKHDRIDQLKAEGYNPWIRSLSAGLSVQIAAAIALVMLAFSIVFECMHYFLSVMKRQAIAARKHLNDLLTKALIQFYEATGHEYNGDSAPYSATDSQQMPGEDLTANAPAESKRGWSVTPAMGVGAGIGTGGDGLNLGVGAGVIATPKPARAEAINELPKEKNTVPKKDENKPDNDTAETDYRFNKQRSWIDGFGFTGNYVRPKRDLKAYSPTGASGVSAKLLSEPNTQNTQPLSIGSTTEHTASEHTENPTEKPCDLPRVSCAPTQNTQETRKPKTHSQNTLYEDWVAGVLAESFRPVARESRSFIQKRLSADQQNKQSMTIKQCGVVSKVFMKKAFRQGVLIRNPNTAKNQPDYLLNTEYNNHAKQS